MIILPVASNNLNPVTGLHRVNKIIVNDDVTRPEIKQHIRSINNGKIKHKKCIFLDFFLCNFVRPKTSDKNIQFELTVFIKVYVLPATYLGNWPVGAFSGISCMHTVW